MKYLSKYKIFESKVDKKIQLLKDIALDLQDAGLEVEVTKGFGLDRGLRLLDQYKNYLKNYIFMSIKDTGNKFNTNLFHTDIIDDFKQTLKSYGMNPRGMSGGDHFVVFKFDKWGKMTDSPILKESSEFFNFKEIILTLKDICQEFEDNNCNYEIFPKDEIKQKIISLIHKGTINNKNVDFRLDIDINSRIKVDDKRSGFISFPTWFIETCKRIEEFMKSNGFLTEASVRYPGDWVSVDVEELQEVTGLIQKVRLNFIPIEKRIEEGLYLL